MSNEPPSSDRDLCEIQVARILNIDTIDDNTFVRYAAGMHSRAVMATGKDVPHRLFEKHGRVVVKLYPGAGTRAGSLRFQNYHESDFHGIQALTANDRLQQSIEGGVFVDVGPYSIVQHIEGESLVERLELTDLSKQAAARILREIIELIWIPLWDSGLRFKDCHPGNFVLTPDMRVVMIDSEQMRIGASELLSTPTCWTKRNRHEEIGLGRLPGLIQRVIEATGSDIARAPLSRLIRTSLLDSGLSESLALLGKSRSTDSALQASALLLDDFTDKDLIE